MASFQQQERINIVFVGDSQVGKTQLLNRLVGGDYREKYLATIGADFKTKDEGNKKLLIWDLAGEQKFRPTISIFFKNDPYVFLTFDLTNRESFASLSGYLTDFESSGGDKKKVVLIGNKNDKFVPDESIPEAARAATEVCQPEVSLEEAKTFCEEKGLLGYFQASAITDTVNLGDSPTGIEAAMKMVIEDHDRRLAQKAKPSRQTIHAVTQLEKRQENLAATAVENLYKYEGVDFEFLTTYLRHKDDNLALFEDEKLRKGTDALIKNLPNSKTETAKNIAANIALAILILITFIVSIPYLLMCDNIYTKNQREHGDRFLFFTDAPKQAAEVAMNLTIREYEASKEASTF